MSIKEELFKQCKIFVNKQIATVEEIVLSNQKALQSETKSSAGDKHETGRAMLQLEIEKASQQLEGINKMSESLAKIDVFKTSNVAHLGSVIFTDKINYFLSISSGKLKVNNQVFFAVSISSPIGKLLLGKKNEEEFMFRGNKIRIKDII